MITQLAKYLPKSQQRPLFSLEGAQLQAFVNDTQSLNLPCEFQHANACWFHTLEKMEHTFSASLKIYIVIHLLPILLFKRKMLRKYPIKTVARFFFALLKSELFILGFPLFKRIGECYFKRWWGYENGAYPSAILTTLGIFFEDGPRRTEITMYVVPRWIEGIFGQLLRRKLVFTSKLGQYLVFGAVMGVLSKLFHKDLVSEKYNSEQLEIRKQIEEEFQRVEKSKLQSEDTQKEVYQEKTVKEPESARLLKVIEHKKRERTFTKEDLEVLKIIGHQPVLKNSFDQANITKEQEEEEQMIVNDQPSEQKQKFIEQQNQQIGEDLNQSSEEIVNDNMEAYQEEEEVDEDEEAANNDSESNPGKVEKQAQNRKSFKEVNGEVQAVDKLKFVSFKRQYLSFAKHIFGSV